MPRQGFIDCIESLALAAMQSSVDDGFFRREALSRPTSHAVANAEHYTHYTSLQLSVADVCTWQ